eukprot:2781169-Prymnesium_polylepis.2
MAMNFDGGCGGLLSAAERARGQPCTREELASETREIRERANESESQSERSVRGPTRAHRASTPGATPCLQSHLTLLNAVSSRVGERPVVQAGAGAEQFSATMLPRTVMSPAPIGARTPHSHTAKRFDVLCARTWRHAQTSNKISCLHQTEIRMISPYPPVSSVLVGQYEKLSLRLRLTPVLTRGSLLLPRPVLRSAM